MIAVELRCPVGPKRLLAIMRQSGEPIKILPDSNLIEFSCSDCRRFRRRDGEEVAQVLHRFNVAGELIETIVVGADSRR